MSKTKHPNPDDVQTELLLNARDICDGLKAVMDKNKISAAELGRRTATSEQNVQRMTRFQEPKGSWLFYAEKQMGLEPGTVYTQAKMLKAKKLPEELLAVDSRLDAQMQKVAVHSVAVWVSASSSASNA